MTDKSKMFFSDNGVWIRWLISVILGLGTIGTTLFYMGKWTEQLDGKITTLTKQDTLFENRLSRLELEGSPIMQKQILSITKDMSYITKALDDNAKAHADILNELKQMNKRP